MSFRLWQRVWVFPTRVGMNRIGGHLGYLRKGVPHARGDEPSTAPNSLPMEQCSPRAWG